MAEERIRIEIVPFPELEDAPVAPSGLTPIDLIEEPDEPADEAAAETTDVIDDLAVDEDADDGPEDVAGDGADDDVAGELVAPEITGDEAADETDADEVPDETDADEIVDEIDADETVDETDADETADADPVLDPDDVNDAAEPVDEAPDADAADDVDADADDDVDLDDADPIEAELDDVDPDGVDPDEADADSDTEFVPTPGARAARRRAGSVLAASAAAEAEDEVAVPHDDSSLRTTSISGRLLFLTLGSVTLAALVALVSIWGVAQLSGASRDVAAISAAKELNADTIAELRVLSTAGDAAAETRRLESLASDADAAARSWLDGDEVRGASDATAAFVESPSDESNRAALVARTGLDSALRDRQIDAIGHAEDLRTSAIAVVLVLFALGSVLLVMIGRAIGRSVVAPLRALGRNLRRFGDGDLRARSTVASDEVGTLARSFNVMADSVSARVRRLNADAERDSQLRMVSDALDLADRETDVYGILDQALGILTPANPAELLVNEPTSSRLWQVSVNPSAGPGGCPVETAEECVAMRRAQAVTFDGPGAINACPQLRLHAEPCSAACVPVGVNGHLLGVIHVTAPEHEPPEAEVVEQLVTLAGQVGVRVGAQRTLETTRLQASTDGLTGLANRRMLEARLGDLLRGQVGFALAVADVDHFKQLNDNYGHETGDRALQLFAKVLEDNVRGHDLVARYGGEEFVLVYPELTVKKAMEVIERIRLALERAIEAAGLPPFTCSFGVTHSSAADSVDSIIRIADAGLLMAKDLGRNRVVFADLDLAAEVFGGGTAADIVVTEPADDVVDVTDLADVPD